jgi:hypothetical protein
MHVRIGSCRGQGGEMRGQTGIGEVIELLVNWNHGEDEALEKLKLVNKPGGP